MERKNRWQQAAASLYDQIVAEGRLKAGAKLPNEVELSQTLGVSRATLREAIRSLCAQGVLEVRRGKGTFVSPRVEEIGDFGFHRLEEVKGRLRDLFELRAIFEPQAAALACRRATAEERSDILAQGAQDRTAADRAFHTAIVRATHNEFMVRLLPIINQAVEEAISTGTAAGELAQATLQDHALLMDFFRKGDEQGAQYAMAIHMRHAMDEMELETR